MLGCISLTRIAIVFMIISGKENRKSSQEMRPSDKNRTFWYMNKYKEWEFLGLKFQHGELEFFFSAMSTI